MHEMTSKVYAFPDAAGRVTAIEGGYTIGNISDFSGWVLIDEGTGDRYNLCQSNYLTEPLTDDRGVYRYKLADGEVVQRTLDEMDADYQQMIAEAMREPTLAERISTMEANQELIAELLLAMME